MGPVQQLQEPHVSRQRSTHPAPPPDRRPSGHRRGLADQRGSRSLPGFLANRQTLVRALSQWPIHAGQKLTTPSLAEQDHRQDRETLYQLAFAPERGTRAVGLSARDRPVDRPQDPRFSPSQPAHARRPRHRRTDPPLRARPSRRDAACRCEEARQHPRRGVAGATSDADRARRTAPPHPTNPGTSTGTR